MNRLHAFNDLGQLFHVFYSNDLYSLWLSGTRPRTRYVEVTLNNLNIASIPQEWSTLPLPVRRQFLKQIRHRRSLRFAPTSIP